VLPYPASIYNNERFPIKSLEYAASGLVIIASNIDSHLELIGHSNGFFYIPGEINSFESQVAKIEKELDLRATKNVSARKWATGFTYEKRVQRVMLQWLGD
jgi:glycosyltransferase involved in cell wall biosynthesis